MQPRLTRFAVAALRRKTAETRILAFGRRHCLAGDPGFPVDALAVAEERNRQPCLPARVHTQPADAAQFRAGILRELDGTLFLEQHRRIRRCDADRARSRHSGRLRHRANAGAQADGADPDRTHDACAVVPDPAVHGISVPRTQQHADRDGDHAPGDHRSDHRLRDGRPFRDVADANWRRQR